MLYVYTIVYFAKLYQFCIKNKNDFVTFLDTFFSKKNLIYHIIKFSCRNFSFLNKLKNISKNKYIFNILLILIII